MKMSNLKEKMLKRDVSKIIELKLTLERNVTPKLQYNEAKEILKFESLTLKDLQELRKCNNNIAQNIISVYNNKRGES